ncbi:hypothetical protein V9T40_011701 [Parthenolecanium corni]|uniref:Uncharacterized protein n=1 Tax=Parthenolecanium corni TaxID=536013 RepID=A0AAN9XZS3_9HEMI
MTKMSSGAVLNHFASTLCWLLMLPYSPATMVRAATAPESSVQSDLDGWIPNAAAFDNSSIAWPPLQRNASSHVTTVKSKAQFGRAFHDNRIDTSATFDFDGDHYKASALPFDANGGSPATPAPESVHFHTLLKPAPFGHALTSGSGAASPFGVTASSVLHSYQQHLQSAGSADGGYHYPAPQYLPPPPSSQYLPAPPVHSIEIASEHREPEHYYYIHQQQQQQVHPSVENGTGSHLETNTENRLFVQPGKCSNSIQVGRTRDVEVRTALKSGPIAQKGVCVLMLYAPNQLNKLAISLQAVPGTTNAIPTGTWLETNIKVYSLQAGDIQPIYTK